jgi:hypothetical protein
MNEIQDQTLNLTSDCGSCWAFATVSTIEFLLNRDA